MKQIQFNEKGCQDLKQQFELIEFCKDESIHDFLRIRWSMKRRITMIIKQNNNS